MVIPSVTPTHHLMIMGSSAAPAGGGLAGGSCRNPEQRLRPGVHLETDRPRLGKGRGQVLHPRPAKVAVSHPATALRDIIASPRTNASGRSRAPVALARLGPQYHDEAATVLRRAIAILPH